MKTDSKKLIKAAAMRITLEEQEKINKAVFDVLNVPIETLTKGKPLDYQDVDVDDVQLFKKKNLVMRGCDGEVENFQTEFSGRLYRLISTITALILEDQHDLRIRQRGEWVEVDYVNPTRLKVTYFNRSLNSNDLRTQEVSFDVDINDSHRLLIPQIMLNAVSITGDNPRALLSLQEWQSYYHRAISKLQADAIRELAYWG